MKEDKYVYRWGFVWHVKEIKTKQIENRLLLPSFSVLYYDKSFIENLKAATLFLHSQTGAENE